MKIKAKRIALLPAILLALLLSCAAASAEESAAERGLSALKNAANRDCITLPKEESWLTEWKTRYARKAWYAPSLFVEGAPLVNSNAYQPFLFEGTEATVLAEENDMSCILYRGADHRLFAGWIQSVRLLEDFPGERYELGEARDAGALETLHEAPQRWSDSLLPYTEQRYTVLDAPVEGCVGFTLEYQLIADHTAAKWMLWGPRRLWVSDGESWTPVGNFPYEEHGAVRVQVWLEQPTDIAAVATVAYCHAPNIFGFRQTAFDFLTERAE